MQFFVDTADTDLIAEIKTLGLLDGVTTNPSLLAKTGKPIKKRLQEICQLVSGPVSAEVTATTAAEMLREANVLRQIADNICIKLPLTAAGLACCRELSAMSVTTNLTLCFSATQALLAARAGASYISPFVGRLDDYGADGMSLIEEIRIIYNNYGFNTKILVASVRNQEHLKQAALIGADVITAPPAVLKSLSNHPLTDIGLSAFLADWQKTGQNIS